MAHSAVNLQLEIKARVPKGLALTRTLLHEVVQHWTETGDAPAGFEVRIIDWKHPGRGRTNSEGFSQDELRHRFARLLQLGRFRVLLWSDQAKGQSSR